MSCIFTLYFANLVIMPRDKPQTIDCCRVTIHLHQVIFCYFGAIILVRGFYTWSIRRAYFYFVVSDQIKIIIQMPPDRPLTSSLKTTSLKFEKHEKQIRWFWGYVDLINLNGQISFFFQKMCVTKTKENPKQVINILGQPLKYCK